MNRVEIALLAMFIHGIVPFEWHIRGGVLFSLWLGTERTCTRQHSYSSSVVGSTQRGEPGFTELLGYHRVLPIPSERRAARQASGRWESRGAGRRLLEDCL